MVRAAHFIWMGSPLPVEFARNMDDFSALHPRWKINLWGLEECREVLDPSVRKVFDEASDYVPPDSVWQFRSDIARLAILYRHSGAYIDTDFAWQKNIDPLLRVSTRTVVTVWEKEGHFVANGFMYSPMKQHPLFQRCLRDLPGQAKTRRGQRANRITGPSGQWTSETRRRRDVKILPSRTMIPYAWNELSRADEDFPDSYAVHHWQHSRQIRGMERR